MSSAVVLVADHDPLQRQLIDLLLAEDRYQVVTVESGREALEYLRQHTPDLAILDLKLYDMSGADVCEKMKSVTRLAPVPVILTAPPRAGVAIDARTKSLAYFVGANEVIQKPLGDKNLRQRVRDLMAQGGLSRFSAIEASETTAVIEEAIRAIDYGPLPEPRAIDDAPLPEPRADPGGDPPAEATGLRLRLASAEERHETLDQELAEGDNGAVGRGSRLPRNMRDELTRLRAKVAEQARTIEELEQRNTRLLEALEEAKKANEPRGLFGRRRGG